MAAGRGLVAATVAVGISGEAAGREGMGWPEGDWEEAAAPDLEAGGGARGGAQAGGG